jgi:L-serine dehydratase
MYKIGVGPSSSHTFGPMVAAKEFAELLKTNGMLDSVTKITATLYGSLSLTGKGHLTDSAIILGLCGEVPESVDLDKIDEIVANVNSSKKIKLAGIKDVDFELIFSKDTLKLHENGMEFLITYGNNEVFSKKYFSIGGGFIKTEEDFNNNAQETSISIPHPFNSAKELVLECGRRKMGDVLLENEKALHSIDEIYTHSKKVRNTMRQALARGLNSTGNLPPPTSLARRAKALFTRLQNNEEKASPIMVQMDWVNVYALAVSEENGAGGRVVTAPTNGACGVIPAVLAYHDRFVTPLDDDTALRFYLVSAAIGALFKQNASISGAEVGCQGEVGVASAMAAAGLAALYDASPEQICIAAEVAMEHHLGLTCDPVNGQVQIPCVERNSLAAVTAINATAMALSRSAETARVSLDEVIEAMRQTGKDMDPKYRETSCGGLATVVS